MSKLLYRPKFIVTPTNPGLMSSTDKSTLDLLSTTTVPNLSSEASSIEEGLAIVINGDTAPKAISKGQYLFIKNHSTLVSGGYHATAAIASGATISSSNVAIDGDGISNALYTELLNHNHNTSYITKFKKASSSITLKSSDASCSVLVTNMNWFDRQISLAWVRCTSMPQTNVYTLAGNAIFSATRNGSAGTITITNTNAYEGAPMIYVLDLAGNITGIS